MTTEDILNLKCECGKNFDRPSKYKTYNEQYPNVAFKWKLQYCDECFHKKASSALEKLPEILNAIAIESTDK